ncbi:MAG: hypothetical protein IJN86_03370, partial [Clostridia bacterium]|nr:hypothetical protein [Clostridia bacterium]
YKTVPDGYVFPESKNRPFFANLYPSGTYFGDIGKLPRNRICIEHYHTEEEPEEPEEPEAPENSEE